MDVGAFSVILQYGLLGWLVALVLIVGWRGRGRWRALIRLFVSEGFGLQLGAADLVRSQLGLALTVTVAVYLAEAVHTLFFMHGARAMPDLPKELLAVFTGSQALYLSGKAGRSRSKEP